MLNIISIGLSVHYFLKSIHKEIFFLSNWLGLAKIYLVSYLTSKRNVESLGLRVEFEVKIDCCVNFLQLLPLSQNPEL